MWTNIIKSIRLFFACLNPHTFFLFFSLLFGSLMLLLNPPFMVPDEPNHFLRAYQISEGTIISVQENQRVGGTLPQSILEVSKPFYPLIWSGNECKLKNIDLNLAWNMPLNQNQRQFCDFINTAFYSPICYAPQALAIFIGRQLDTPPLKLVYLARIFSLLFWCIVVYFSIQLIPIGKWLMTFLALLPMSLFVNSSLSADVVTNAVAFLFIAYVLHLCLVHNSLRPIHYVFIMALIMCLSMIKPVYFFLAGLLVLVPKSGKDFILLLLCSLPGLILCFLWMHLIRDLQLGYDQYNHQWRDFTALAQGADLNKQLDYVMTNPGSSISRIKNSILLYFSAKSGEYIGVFGWITMPMPNWLVVFTYICLFPVSMFGSSEGYKLRLSHKLVLFIVFTVSLGLNFLAQYLWWTPVGGQHSAIQGRYLIPIAPLFFLMLQSRWHFKPYVAPIVVISVLLGLMVSLNLLLMRYY